MGTAPQTVQNKQLLSAIMYAIPKLEDQGQRVRDVPIQVDNRKGTKQTGTIDAPAVRSIILDIAVSTGQPLPVSCEVYMPNKGAQFMSVRSLQELINHLRQLARAL